MITMRIKDLFFDRPAVAGAVNAGKRKALSKAGAFIRLKPRSKETIRVYTPHGGSLHYPLNTLKGALYSRLERALMNSTDLFLFESAFARDTYQRTIGVPRGVVRCGFNGGTADEFDPNVPWLL